MKRIAGVLLLFVLMIATPVAHADGTQVTMTFLGVNEIHDANYYVAHTRG